ncbi:MAG: glycosyltransferase family 4 protein [Caldilineaceae bacterium]|nr:glycosyltransferase family 4 protein [Caldilineaceae bacterium]
MSEPSLPSQHILFVAPFGLGQKTTVWARTLPLARELVRRGHRAHILIPPWDTPADAGRTWQEEGVTLENVSLRGGIPSTVLRMITRIDALAPDIVHIVKPRAHAGLVQWRLWHRRRRPPLVLDLDDWEQAWAAVNDYGPVTARFLARQEEWGIRHADAITAASRWLEARAQEYSPTTPVTYLPNGVTLPPRPPALRADPQPPAVLFFSRFVEVEPEWTAKFWRAVAEMAPAAHLIVAGQPVQPGLDERLMLIMGEYAGTEGVAWLGFVEPDQLAALYDRTTVAVFPAAPVPLQQAKCSVRLATTLLNGIPVVASAVGEQAQYGASGAARLVDAQATPEEFARVTVNFLEDRAARSHAIVQAYAHLSQNYQWHDLADRLEACYAGIGSS